MQNRNWYNNSKNGAKKIAHFCAVKRGITFNEKKMKTFTS